MILVGVHVYVKEFLFHYLQITFLVKLAEKVGVLQFGLVPPRRVFPIPLHNLEYKSLKLIYTNFKNNLQYSPHKLADFPQIHYNQHDY